MIWLRDGVCQGLFLRYICGVVFLSWSMTPQSQMEKSVELSTKITDKYVGSTAAVHEIPSVQIDKSAIFPVAGLRTLLISFVIMGNQGYMSNSKLMWRNMQSFMTFLIAASGILKFKSANGVTRSGRSSGQYIEKHVVYGSGQLISPFCS